MFVQFLIPYKLSVCNKMSSPKLCGFQQPRMRYYKRVTHTKSNLERRNLSSLRRESSRENTRRASTNAVQLNNARILIEAQLHRLLSIVIINSTTVLTNARHQSSHRGANRCPLFYPARVRVSVRSRSPRRDKCVAAALRRAS